jgi:hypothetical protein
LYSDVGYEMRACLSKVSSDTEATSVCPACGVEKLQLNSCTDFSERTICIPDTGVRSAAFVIDAAILIGHLLCEDKTARTAVPYT